MKRITLIFLIVLFLVSCQNIDNTSDLSKIENEKSSDNPPIVSESDTEITDYPYFRVLSETLNIRETPDEDGNIIAAMKENYIFQINDEKTDDEGRLWYKVSHTDGFVASWYCKNITLSPANIEETYAAIYMNTNASINKAHDKNSIVLAKVTRGEFYKILDTYFESKDEYWYKIVTKEGVLGWIPGKNASEYRSDTGRIRQVREKFDDIISLYNQEHSGKGLDHLIDDMIASTPHAIKGDVKSFANHKIFSLSVEDTQYVYRLNPKMDMVSFVLANTYAEPEILYDEKYLSFKSFNGRELEHRILDLDDIKPLSSVKPLMYDKVHFISNRKVLIYEENNRYSDLLQNKERLTNINFYDLTKDKIVPFKEATSEYDWTLGIDKVNVTIYRNDWQDDKLVKRELYLESRLDYWPYPIKENPTYLPVGSFDMPLQEKLASLSDEAIVKHVKNLEASTLGSKVEFLKEFETDAYLYFDLISVDYENELSQGDKTLLKWEKRSQNYEFIKKIKFDAYISKALKTSSYKTIVDYIRKSRLYTDVLFPSIEYETESLYMFGVLVGYNHSPEEHLSLVIWDKNYRYGGMVTKEIAIGLKEIIDENLLITYNNDFVDTYHFYNLSQFGSEDFLIGSINANKYSRLGNSDWLIIETTHPDDDHVWTLPFKTGIDLMNIQTGERVNYLSSDKMHDWIYEYNESQNTLKIIHKEIIVSSTPTITYETVTKIDNKTKALIITQVEKEIYLETMTQVEHEVLDLNDLDNFIEKISFNESKKPIIDQQK